LLGLSLAADQIPALPFPTDPRYPDTPYATSPQYAPSGWRDADRQLEQEEIENHNPLSPQDIYGVSMLSAPPESPSHTMFAGTSSSLSVESYTQSRLEDNYADLTSFPCGQVESITENLPAIQGQIATTYEASFSRERKVQRKKVNEKARKKVTGKARKKEQDKARKRADRYEDEQDHEEICNLLNINLKPKNKLAHRSE
jgi:hypothetical protein